MKPRKLALRTERLTELSSDDLRAVVGGAVITTLTGTETYKCPTVPLNQCFVIVATDLCPTVRGCFD